MTAELASRKELLKELVGAYVNRPSEIALVANPSADGSVYWAMQGASDDEGILIGAAGTHVNALKFLVEELGAANEGVWTFRLITEGRPRQRTTNGHRDGLMHDPKPARDLLSRLIAEFVEDEFAVEIAPPNGPVNNLSFTFKVRVRDAADYRRLTIPKTADGYAIVSALGTLFRAIAKKAGARYQIDVVQ